MIAPAEDARLFRWASAGEWVREARAVLDAFRAPFPALPPDPPPAPPHHGAWLRRLLGPAGEHALRELAGRFSARYDAVEAFHAGRPDDPASFARDGVRASSAAALAAEARERFVDGRVVIPAAFDDALRRQDLSIVEGCCGFSLDGRYPVERETFYLHYGSHFLLGMAVQLQRATGADLRPRLRARGVPTLVACAVPLSRVPHTTVEAVCRECLRLALAGRDGGTPPHLRLDFTLDFRLGPEHVRRIEHPAAGPDPWLHRSGRKRRFDHPR